MKIPMDGLAKVMVKEIYALAGEDIPIVTRYYTDERGNKHAHELLPCRNEHNFCDVRHCDKTEVEHQTAVSAQLPQLARSSFTEHMGLPKNSTSRKKGLDHFRSESFSSLPNKPQCKPAPPT